MKIFEKSKTKENLNSFKFRLRRSLSCDQLYQLIHFQLFPAGIPKKTGKGVMQCIHFSEHNEHRIQIRIEHSFIYVEYVYIIDGMIQYIENTNPCDELTHYLLLETRNQLKHILRQNNYIK